MSMRRPQSRIVYENQWMRVREDSFVRSDGSEGVYGVVEKVDFALVIPIEDGHVYLVEQYRYPVGARFWELPQGSWDEAADPEALARGELAEETGLRAGRLEHLGRLHEAYGYSTQAFDVFLATELVQGPRQLDPEEQDLRVGRFSLEAFEGMVRSGQIKDSPTVAAWGLMLLRGP